MFKKKRIPLFKTAGITIQTEGFHNNNKGINQSGAYTKKIKH